MRKAMAKDPAAVKAALCTIANRHFETASNSPMGIYKAEGGVRVNGRDIVIHADSVVDDNKIANEPTPEEQAVVAVIAEVAEIVKNRGVKALRADYGECIKGDPLQRFLGLS